MRYQVELCLKEALEANGVAKAAPLARQLHITPSHFRALKAGTWTDISRGELQRLSSWVKSRGGNERDLFKVVPHPIWGNFAHEAYVFEGSGPMGHVLEFDKKAGDTLTEFLHGDSCQVHHERVALPQGGSERTELVEKVTDLMRTRNCVFIGAPRQSAATEVAVANIWRTQPFASNVSAKIPFTFSYPDFPSSLTSTFARVDLPERRGLELRTRRGPIGLLNPFMEREVWARHTGLCWDFAVVVVCVRPLDTTENVTTVVVSGVTGLATHAAALELAKETLYIDGRGDSSKSRRSWRVLCARFLKADGLDGRALQNHGHRWVGPPWVKWPPKLRPKPPDTTDYEDEDES